MESKYHQVPCIDSQQNVSPVDALRVLQGIKHHIHSSPLRPPPAGHFPTFQISCEPFAEVKGGCILPKALYFHIKESLSPDSVTGI